MKIETLGPSLEIMLTPEPEGAHYLLITGDRAHGLDYCPDCAQAQAYLTEQALAFRELYIPLGRIDDDPLACDLGGRQGFLAAQQKDIYDPLKPSIDRAIKNGHGNDLPVPFLVRVDSQGDMIGLGSVEDMKALDFAVSRNPLTSPSVDARDLVAAQIRRTVE